MARPPRKAGGGEHLSDPADEARDADSRSEDAVLLSDWYGARWHIAASPARSSADWSAGTQRLLRARSHGRASAGMAEPSVGRW